MIDDSVPGLSKVKYGIVNFLSYSLTNIILLLVLTIAYLSAYLVNIGI